MSQLVSYSGDEGFYNGGSIYSYPKEAANFSPLRHHDDVYYPHKRARINAPVVPFEQKFEPKNHTSIDALPDECLFEILKRLPAGQERIASACVSKRWLMLLSSIPVNKSSKDRPNSKDVVKEDGFLTRCLEGKKATGVRLAAIAVGTSARGGLGKLIIRGTNPDRGVTSVDLRAIACCCPSLRVLSLWNVPSVGDEGMIEIAQGCNRLEKIDLSHCPLITEKALVAIAIGSPNLTSLTIDSCQNVGNEGLQAVGKFCPKLKCISIKDCPLVGDQGITSLLSSASNVLKKVKLQRLSISDVSLAVVGHYCLAVTDLVLSDLHNMTERGFWCMGKGHGLQMLNTLGIESCRGVTDLGLESVGKGSPNMKTFSLRKCEFLSDNGLVSFARAVGSLESLNLDECHSITQLGFFGLLLNCGPLLKAVSISNCFVIKEMPIGLVLPESARSYIRSLTIRKCPLFGDVNLALLSTLCTHIQFLDLSGLVGISDNGITPLIESSDAGLVKVKLDGCVNLTDESVLALTRTHGGTLELLNLEGCGKITDISLVAIAEYCLLLNDLNISRCAISDLGISALSWSKQLVTLCILSLSGCTSVSDKCRPFLAKLGPSLVGLDVKNCNGISSSVVDMLSVRLWNCNILS